MKKMKKLFAALLSTAMVLGLTTTAFAAPNAGKDGKFGTSDDKGTITVSGIAPEEGDKIQVVAYKIVEAEYNNSGESFSGYKALYVGANDNSEDYFSTEQEKADDPSTPDIDESALAKITINDEQLKNNLAKIPADAVIDNQTTNFQMTPSTDGATYTANVPVGAYLVMITGAEKKIYSNVVVSLYYTNASGSANGIDEGSVDVADDEANAWVKIQDNPEVEKKITNGDQNNDKGNTVDIGDTVDYEIKVPSIPYYGGDYPTFNLVDTLDPALEYVETKGWTMMIGDDEMVLGSDGNIYKKDAAQEFANRMGTFAYDKTNRTLTFDFVLDKDETTGKGTYTLNDYQTESIVIKYSALVKENATLNQVANENDVVLNFTHDSKVKGNDGTDDDKTYTYTFDIDGQIDGSITEKIIAKVGESVKEGERKPLKGAEFTLYWADLNDDGTPKLDANGAWAIGKQYENTSKDDGSKFNGVITSSDKDDNNLAVNGLQAGKYILKETKAPDGYSLNTHQFQIAIDVTLNETTGKLESWTIKIDNEFTASFNVTTDAEPATAIRTDDSDTVVIPNTKLTELPSTGGIGTTIFTIGGCAIMIIAAALFFASRRKSAK